MRKIILESLKTKFEGVSEQVLSRVADKLAKTVKAEADVAPAVEGVTIQQIIDSYGDSRATEAQQTAVRNYESKYGLKDGAKVEVGGGSTNHNATEKASVTEDVPQWAKAIIESNKAMTERLNKMDIERTTTTRKQQLSTIISKLPETLRKAYERTPLDNLSDDEFMALQNDITEEVKTIVTENNAKGAVFGRPINNGVAKNASSDKEASAEEVAAVVDKLTI